MKEPIPEEVLLTLIARPGLEEHLIDWLLAREHQGFTTLACEGHGVSPQQLAAAEQVAGRQDRVAVWIQLSAGRARELVEALRASFGHAGLHYWISPLLESGPIAPTEAGEGAPTGCPDAPPDIFPDMLPDTSTDD
jgi:hypothetical protein